MGNSCECVRRQNSDEAEDALLASLVGEGTDVRPRGPPPPYQPQAPVYNYSLATMSEEQRTQLVRRITIIQSLPCVHYELRGDKDKKKEPRECAICMMDYCVGEPIRLLPCMHYYHLHCIDDWLMRSLTCPTCMERVDIGLMTTIRSSGGSIGGGSRAGGSSRGGGGRRGGFGLRRRHRGRGQGGWGSGSGTPLMSGESSSRSSSRSSSTSSSTEQLMAPGGQFSWQPPQGGNPSTPQQQRSSQSQGVLSNNSGTIFLPPFPSSPALHPLSQNSGIRPPQNPPLEVGPPSSPTSPLLPTVTIHTAPLHAPN